jgi:hypothetical protein
MPLTRGSGGTKTAVPLRWSLRTIEERARSSLSWTYDGLGAARGQRSRKGPCASHPTHHHLSFAGPRPPLSQSVIPLHPSY